MHSDRGEYKMVKHKYTIKDLLQAESLDENTLIQQIENYAIAAPNEKGEYSFDANTYFLLTRINKIRTQGLTPEVENQKITQLVRNRKNNATISDVAALANVSIGSVSRVLNKTKGKINISEKTRIRIMNAAQELGYRPNPFASALRSRKSGVIGAVIRDITDQFMQQLIEGVQDVCNKRGLDVLMSHAKQEKLTTEHQINLMRNQFFDGLIILGDMEGDEVLMEQLSHYNTPIVSLDGRHSDFISTVRFDDQLSGTLSADYLFSLGHQRVALIGNMEHSAVCDRMNAFIACWKQQQPNEAFIKLTCSASTIREAMEQTTRLLALPQPPTAISCSNDLLAQGALCAAWQMGLRVPEDISILGFNNIVPLCEAYQLTTVQQPIPEAARAAVTELQRQMVAFSTNEAMIPNHITIKPRLKIRSTCSQFSKQ